MTLRNEENNERPFYLAVPVPRDCKIKLQIKSSQFSSSKDLNAIKIKGYSYESLNFKSNYSKHRQVSHMDVLDIQTGTPKKTSSGIVNTILEYTGLAITDFNELATR